MNASTSQMPYRWRYWYRLHYVANRHTGEVHTTRNYHTPHRQFAIINRDRNEYENGIACWIEWLDSEAARSLL